MTEEQPAVVRAQGRPDGDQLPVVGLPPHPGHCDVGADVRWVEDGSLLAVTTWGSISHPRVPRTVRLTDGEPTLTLGAPVSRAGTPNASAVMSADLSACTSLVEPPAGLDPHAHTRVHLGRAVLNLPPAGTPLAPTVQLRPMPTTPPPLPHPPTGGRGTTA